MLEMACSSIKNIEQGISNFEVKEKLHHSTFRAHLFGVHLFDHNPGY